MSLLKFLAHYNDELSIITGTLGTLKNALPIDQQDKANIQKGLDALATAGANIAAAIPKLKKEAKVVIKKSDIEAAVKSVLGPLVKQAVDDALAAKAKTNVK